MKKLLKRAVVLGGVFVISAILTACSNKDLTGQYNWTYNSDYLSLILDIDEQDFELDYSLTTVTTGLFTASTKESSGTLASGQIKNGQVIFEDFDTSALSEIISEDYSIDGLEDLEDQKLNLKISDDDKKLTLSDPSSGEELFIFKKD